MGENIIGTRRRMYTLLEPESKGGESKMMVRLHAIKRRAANREWLIIGTRGAIVWKWVVIDNEAGGERGWSLNYSEEWAADQLQSVASMRRRFVRY